MKLPVRIRFDGNLYEDVEIREVSGSDIAEVKRVGENGDIYTAFLTFAVACTSSLGDIEDRAQIREAYKKASFDTVYAVAIFGMAKTRGIDKIEGRYRCRCGAEISHMDDFADPLPTYDPRDPEDVKIDVGHVEIRNTKTAEVLFSADSLTLRLPTTEDCIKAFRKYPDDNVTMQFEIYKNCLLQVDDREISDKDRNNFGVMLFQKLKFNDLNRISSVLVSSFGQVECVCLKCKRRWKAPLDLTNFFDYEADMTA